MVNGLINEIKMEFNMFKINESQEFLPEPIELPFDLEKLFTCCSSLLLVISLSFRLPLFAAADIKRI